MIEKIQYVIGKAYDDNLKTVLALQGVRYRIVSENGQPFMVKADYDSSRLNLSIDNGIVVNAYYG